MLNKKPETYNELILSRNILAISHYYQVSQEFIDEAYDFIVANPTGSIVCGEDRITFKNEQASIIKVFAATSLRKNEIDALIVKKDNLNIVPHYTSSSSSGSGGSSSNNNNNNNNNNNH